jgi:hypothetical protein
MAVTLGTVTANSMVSGSSYSFSHNHGGGSNGCLIVWIAMGNTTVSGITYNGVALTLVDSTVGTAIDADKMEVWRLINPATGSNLVAVTLTSGTESKAAAISLSGVHQTVPIGTPVEDSYTADSEAHAHDTTCETDGLVLDGFITHFGGPAVTTNWNAGQSLVTNMDAPAWEADITSKPGATTVNTGYTWDSPGARWVHLTVPLMPAATAASWTIIGRTVLDYVD